MRVLLLLWALPMGFFWGWYLLSLNDLNFGTIFLSRELHDLVFRLYGETLGVPARDVPAMVAGACAFDTAIVMAIAALRWRKSWYPQTRAFLTAWLRRYVPGTDSQDGQAAGHHALLAREATALPDGPARPAE